MCPACRVNRGGGVEVGVGGFIVAGHTQIIYTFIEVKEPCTVVIN